MYKGIKDHIMDMKETEVIFLSKKSWVQTDQYEVVIMKFNGNLYQRFMIQKRGKIIGRYLPGPKEIADEDFYQLSPSQEVQANFFKRFYLYQQNVGFKAIATDIEIVPSSKDVIDTHVIEKVCHRKKAHRDLPNAELKVDKNTIYRTGMIGVSVHCPFGPSTKSESFQSNGISFRARFSKSKRCINGIKPKYFEFSDAGLVAGRFYLDTYIIENGLDMHLHYSRKDYDFIAKYNANTWIEATAYDSGFDYLGVGTVLLNKYSTVDREYMIPKSYPRKIITVPESMLLSVIPADEFSELSNFRKK